MVPEYVRDVPVFDFNGLDALTWIFRVGSSKRGCDQLSVGPPSKMLSINVPS